MFKTILFPSREWINKFFQLVEYTTDWGENSFGVLDIPDCTIKVKYIDGTERVYDGRGGGSDGLMRIDRMIMELLDEKGVHLKCY